MKVNRIDSSDKNVSKYVFDFGNAIAESVLYKYNSYEERTVICCSTQSGCPIGCRFCGAGDNFIRSLKSDEIIAQVLHLFEDRYIDPTSVNKLQIMFMSMGEPMLNFNELSVAIDFLHCNFPHAALLISTSGPKVSYSKLIAQSKRIAKIGLQFSVHESTDEKRNSLVPFKSKLTLREIAREGLNWHYETGRRPFFNYCAHEANTTEEDSRRLSDLFDPRIWEATVSVICERDESIAAANSRQRNLATGFMGLLQERGFNVRCFDPAGQDDIGGGCGQLWFVQDWMKQNPGLVRPSIGSGLPKIHTPIDGYGKSEIFEEMEVQS